MADLSCVVAIPDVPGLASEELTVGRVFNINCSGTWPQDWDAAKFKPVLAENNQYVLKILNAKSSPNGVSFDVTSYVAGKVDIPNLVIKNAEQEVGLGHIQFQVVSLIDPKQPKQEPYGPFGPFAMAIPMSWWIGLGLLLVIIGSAMGWRIRKSIIRRRVLKELAEYDSPMSPSAEFHAQMRKLQRQSPIFAGGEGTPADNLAIVLIMEKAFRTFMMRRFRVPALQWGDSAVLQELSYGHPEIAEQWSEQIKKLWKEFSLAKTAKVSSKDVLQLAGTSRMLIEQMDRQITLMERGKA